MKPILFNAEMVRAIQNGTKTVTRRAVKPKTPYHYCREKKAIYYDVSDAPYHPGDILYVRETWCSQVSEEYPFVYRASVKTPEAWVWRPSIHMPREAARIFLRVTDVRVERLQDITEEQAKAEGAAPAFKYNTMEGPVIVLDDSGYFYFGFECLWASTIKKADRALYGWDANPWLWVIEFERISREEAVGGA